jgi:hypothetical protein
MVVLVSCAFAGDAMKCPTCGSLRAKRNGGDKSGPRGWCPDHSGSFRIDDATQARFATEANLARQGIAPTLIHPDPAPAGFVVNGVSSLVRPDGSIAGQWIKMGADRALQQSLMEAAVAAMRETIPHEEPRIRHVLRADDPALLNLFVLTDYHLGMLAWAEECGEDWDLRIAEDLLVAWFQVAIRLAPAARKAVFAQLGDFLHWDGFDAVTPAHHHILDADTRFQKLVRCGIRVRRRIIAMLLDKYPEVVSLEAEGNHDPASSVHTREWMAELYRDEPRIEVITSPDPYYCIEHGLTSLFFHHGHKRGPSPEIVLVLAAKFREILGRTKHSFLHMGHLHHTKVLENPIMEVEQHRTLAAKDAFASRGGWMSGRSANVITYHAELGEVSRLRISPDMVAARRERLV